MPREDVNAMSREERTDYYRELLGVGKKGQKWDSDLDRAFLDYQADLKGGGIRSDSESLEDFEKRWGLEQEPKTPTYLPDVEEYDKNRWSNEPRYFNDGTAFSWYSREKKKYIPKDSSHWDKHPILKEINIRGDEIYKDAKKKGKKTETDKYIDKVNKDIPETPLRDWFKSLFR